MAIAAEQIQYHYCSCEMLQIHAQVDFLAQIEHESLCEKDEKKLKNVNGILL